MIKRFLLLVTTPRAVRLAQQKRRLESIARAAGCSRRQAANIARAYLS